ncbi:MAG: polyamine ABC transporter substrate-binding protein [Thermoleophilaceae bacterium]
MLNRRDLLRGGAGLALGAGLAGCGVGNVSRGSREETERPIKKRVDGDLVYFNYAEYVDPELVKGFEKRYGVTVRESYFDSMPAMMAKLRAGIAYDLIFPSAEYVQRLNAGNLIRRIDRDKLRNVDTVYSYFDDPWYDANSEHSTPYAMYATGLGYRADKVSGMTGSWRDLGEADSDDRSFLLDDYQEAIGMANLVSGYELNEIDPDKLEDSKQYLVDLKPKLRGISADTTTNMTSGNAYIQHLWNGDIVNIRFGVDNPEDYKFQKCSEGLPVGSDNFVIPVNAKHPGTALLFIEYMLEPENGAQNVEWIGYPMPYEGGPTEAFEGLVKDDPEISLTIEDLEQGQQYVNLKGDGRLAWDEVWTEFKVS